MDHLYLGTQFFWHRWSVGHVLTIKTIAESLARGIEHHDEVRCFILAKQAAQHVYNAIYCARGLSFGINQIGHSVKGAIQVGRTVNQYQFFKHRRDPWRATGAKRTLGWPG